MENNVKFEANGNVCRVNHALRIATEQIDADHMLYWLSGFEEQTGDVLIFFHEDTLKKLGDEELKLLIDVRQSLRKEGFDIVEERNVYDNEFYEVCFYAKLFRLRV